MTDITIQEIELLTRESLPFAVDYGFRVDSLDSGISTVRAIGDAWAPATIATAVFEGHRYARELENPEFRGDHVPFRRETVELVAPELI